MNQTAYATNLIKTTFEWRDRRAKENGRRGQKMRNFTADQSHRLNRMSKWRCVKRNGEVVYIASVQLWSKRKRKELFESEISICHKFVSTLSRFVTLASTLCFSIHALYLSFSLAPSKREKQCAHTVCVRLSLKCLRPYDTLRFRVISFHTRNWMQWNATAKRKQKKNSKQIKIRLKLQMKINRNASTFAIYRSVLCVNPLHVETLRHICVSVWFASRNAV